jgi:hypothetical protein
LALCRLCKQGVAGSIAKLDKETTRQVNDVNGTTVALPD